MRTRTKINDIQSNKKQKSNFVKLALLSAKTVSKRYFNFTGLLNKFYSLTKLSYQICSLQALKKEVNFVVFKSKSMNRSWVKINKTRQNGWDWPYLNQCVRLDRDEYEEFLFNMYLHHNLNILASKYDSFIIVINNRI
jgi:hypothetical protein